MPAVEFSVLLLMVFAPFQPIQGEDLRPPQNITIVSKDYNLFMKWLPPDGSPPGVSYTVRWREIFEHQWKEVQHCRNTTETVCNITCVFQEPSNRYQVKVEAQSRIGAGFISSVPEIIDYILQVQLAPPVLRVKYTRNILGVDVSFTYPSCMKGVFQDLTYDLEIWRGEFQKLVILEDTHEPSVEVPTTDWLYGKHCLRARTSFRNEDKQSNFSEPLCLWLPEEGPGGVQGTWEIIAIPLLIILVTGGVMLFFCSRHMIKQVEMPSALDFSKYQHPKNLLEFDERELTLQNVNFILEGKITSALLTPSVDSLSKESEDSEDEDDSCSRVPYTKTLRFQKKDESGSTVGTFPTCSGSSSGSGDSQLSRENWPASTMSETFFTAEWMTAGASSGLAEKTFLSEDSIMDESVSFADDFSAPSREGQEIASRDIDFLNQLMFSGSHDVHFSTGLELRTGGVQCGSICSSLENSQASLCSQAEGQFVEEWRCENDSSHCEALQLETPLLDGSCKDRVENGERVESNTLKSAGHNYQPRQGCYISRT